MSLAQKDIKFGTKVMRMHRFGAHTRGRINLMEVELSSDKYYVSLPDDLKVVLEEKISTNKFHTDFLDKNMNYWHGTIQDCPQCQKKRVTSSCACGCGNCYTCDYRFCCVPPTDIE